MHSTHLAKQSTFYSQNTMQNTNNPGCLCDLISLKPKPISYLTTAFQSKVRVHSQLPQTANTKLLRECIPILKGKTQTLGTGLPSQSCRTGPAHHVQRGASFLRAEQTLQPRTVCFVDFFALRSWHDLFLLFIPVSPIKFKCPEKHPGQPTQKQPARPAPQLVSTIVPCFHYNTFCFLKLSYSFVGLLTSYPCPSPSTVD